MEARMFVAATGAAALAAALCVSMTVESALAKPVAARKAVVGVTAVNAAWTAAANANDVDALVACYAADAVAWFPDAPKATGREEIRAGYQDLLARYTLKDVRVTDHHESTVGAHSVGWGTFSMTLVPRAGGEALMSTGRYTELAVKRGGRWVYLVDHASSDPPATKPEH